MKLIFELDRDIDETKLYRKFHHDLTLLSKVSRNHTVGDPS